MVGCSLDPLDRFDESGVATAEGVRKEKLVEVKNFL
jgi:hypothetical protein